MGSLLPGLALAGLYLTYAAAIALFRPKAAPALPLEMLDITKAQLAKRIFLVMLPPLFLILIVLGSIFAGLATPTEACAMGGFGALVLAAINRRLQLRTLTESLKSTIALSFGYDLVWFGVMLGVNLQTSFLTPPFGFSLFYLREVSPPEVKTTDIYRGVVPFIAIQLVALLLLIRFPQLATWVLA